jgi:hypothetical protein
LVVRVEQVVECWLAGRFRLGAGNLGASISVLDTQSQRASLDRQYARCKSATPQP